MARKPIERRPNAARRRPRRWPWVAFAIVILLLVAVFVSRVMGGKSEVARGAAAGIAVPTLSLPSTAGHPISLNDYKGKKLVVYFYEGST